MGVTIMARDIPGYEYFGDVDIRYGGKYICARKPEYRYSGNVGHVIEVLDGSYFEDGKARVIAGYIYTGRDISEWRRAIKSCGYLGSMRSIAPHARRLLLLDAIHSYYGADTETDMYNGPHDVAVDPDDEDAIYAAVERFAR
jgi:hypothetical protein